MLQLFPGFFNILKFAFIQDKGTICTQITSEFPVLKYIFLYFLQGSPLFSLLRSGSTALVTAHEFQRKAGVHRPILVAAALVTSGLAGC
jgi:hypothetical protein